MSRLASFSIHALLLRALPLTALGAVAIGATMCASDGLAFAETPVLEIRSTSVVGPMAGTTLSPAVRLDVRPSAVDTSIEMPVTGAAAVGLNRSTCRQDLAGPVMTITIPELSYSCPVYAGGQTMLDSGAATLISDKALSQVLADHPGGAGLLWVAGHRASHGGAFAAVPDLADGAIITVTDATFTASYRVVGRLHFGVENDRVIDASGQATSAATLDSIIRPDHGGHGAARLLLQTCDGENFRWMIYADLVTG